MKKHFWLIVILLLAIVLRFYHNTQISLWHDEAFSALLVKYPWKEMMYRIGLDVHPPMYYIFLRLWYYVFGDSLLALRSFSIFFGVGTILATWAFVKTAFGNLGGFNQNSEKVAIWAALLIALSPFQLQYVTEARMYTMGAFFTVLAAYFLTKALKEQKEFFEDQALHMPNLPKDISLHRHYVWHYLGFAICSAIIILTHYYLLFTMAALCLYALVFHISHYKTDFKKYFELFLSYILIIFCFLPWLKVFLFQYKQVQEGYWIEKMNIWSIPSTLWQMFLGISIDPAKAEIHIGLILVTLFSVFFLYRFLRKTQDWSKWLVFLGILAPFAGSLLFVLLARIKGSNSSVYLVRYFLFASTFYSIALAVWFSQIKPKFIAITLFVVYCCVNFWAFTNYWSELKIETRTGMHGAAKYLKANVEPNHKLYSGTSFMFFNLKYYRNQLGIQNPPQLFTGGTKHAKDISHYAGSAILTDEDLVPDFTEATKPSDIVWLVWTEAFGSRLPEIPKNWVKLEEKSFLEVRPYPWAQVIVTQYQVN